MTLENDYKLSSEIAYRRFISSLPSEVSKDSYNRWLHYFMDWMQIGKTEYDRLLDYDPRILQSKVIDYVIWMKEEKRLSSSSIKSRIVALHHFYDMAEYEGLKWKIIEKFKPEGDIVAEDRPYTREEISKMLENTLVSKRDRSIVLLFASSGIREGALTKLTIKDLIPIEKYHIYMLAIYRKSRKDRYITFCTPEARKAIDDYLQWRHKLGEKLTADSPVFRRSFNKRDVLQIRNMVKPLTRLGVYYIIQSIAISAGIRQIEPLTETNTRGRRRCKIMAVHGLRKFFDTTCEMAGVDTLFIEILMGHKIGLKKSYFKPTDIEVLEGNDKKRGYLDALPALTIQITKEENEKLRQELDSQNKRENELKAMKEQVLSMQSQMQTVLSVLSSIKTEEGKQEIAKELILRDIYTKTDSSFG
jgi:site-specific recombinase XerD